MRMQEYAVHADYAPIREYANADEVEMAIFWAKYGSVRLCF